MPLPYAACFSQSPAGRRSNKCSAAMPDTASGSTAWLTDLRNPSATRISRSPSARSKIMTDKQLAAMHRLLAEHHRKLATESLLAVVQQYHADLSQRIGDWGGPKPRAHGKP